MLWSGVWSDEDQMYVCVGRDITEEVLTRQKLQQKEELHQALMEHGANVTKMVDEEGKFLYTSGSALYEFGYSPEQLVGKSAFSLIHPNDVSKVQTSLSELLTGKDHVTISEFQFKAADGSYRWLEGVLSNQLHNPSVKAIITTTRDITERIETRQRLQESEQRYKSLFENHADAILFQNREGLIIDANPITLTLLKLTEQEILGRPLSDFLPDETIPICNLTLQQALRGKAVRYELPIPFGGKDVPYFDVIKIPVNVDGEIIGVYSILRDVTKTYNSNRIIEQQAYKLDNILESITDAFITLDKDWRFSYVNTVFANQEGYTQDELMGKNIWETFPSMISTDFQRNCKEALESGQARHFEESYHHTGKAFRYSVYPSGEGLSIYFTDITEALQTKEELEKLSLVASRTTNSVIITDRERKVEWVNDGFTRLTGYTLDEALGHTPNELLQYTDGLDEEANKVINAKLLKGTPASFEVLSHKKNGEKVWVSVEATPIHDESGNLVRIISIQTDITALKKSELSLARLTEDLYRQNSDLQQFTYIVSHNLRSPIANALGLSTILQKADRSSATYDTALKNLQESALKLDTVVRDVNTILSIRDNKHTQPKELVEITEVCQQAFLNLQESLEHCDGKVTFDIQEGLSVKANKAYLHSIFYNLMSNAIKYRSSERALNLQVKCYTCPEKGAVITISDNGLGFDMEKVGNDLFKLYKRFHPDKKGRGIGLYLVKTHVEAMEGRIEVSSQVDVGTSFSIYLS
ncbi:hypothetical protein PKOR_01720 [Pontibacter korlensis]|uniref:histidine kinase n=2 Tax=Pontibacter korlensis TaxID=400092 RepID=A0A0E3UVR5_9BACT|nr:hypothetical protein PKOR_01720 [Pontibacter korlensis]